MPLLLLETILQKIITSDIIITATTLDEAVPAICNTDWLINTTELLAYTDLPQRHVETYRHSDGASLGKNT